MRAPPARPQSAGGGPALPGSGSGQSARLRSEPLRGAAAGSAPRRQRPRGARGGEASEAKPSLSRQGRGRSRGPAGGRAGAPRRARPAPRGWRGRRRCRGGAALPFPLPLPLPLRSTAPAPFLLPLPSRSAPPRPAPLPLRSAAAPLRLPRPRRGGAAARSLRGSGRLPAWTWGEWRASRRSWRRPAPQAVGRGQRGDARLLLWVNLGSRPLSLGQQVWQLGVGRGGASCLPACEARTHPWADVCVCTGTVSKRLMPGISG